ncbi:hypothetical protein ASPVEDRAFT_150500 [Aspergillus versicolor CBS 583.65]|uniref:Uncharacterized protein n=1 Tax=Aspergillus versicolor CBS 583.65 TaxID=1036611 RepID=A0A1L9PJI2_ASPVE|nr:uncharacterized protein ASPVEDRAFT_150500 [Aspergillus versicolor CBS 583.65]OJJ01684.1 hypothetical protein ASPVEDRAFT_150500 [Aspergillus versicolor CBS 583.65]
MRDCFFNDLAGGQMDIPFRASGPLPPAPEADPIAPGNRPPPPSPQPPEPEQEQSVHVPSEEIEDEPVEEFFTPPETSPSSMAQAQAQENVGQELPITTPEITVTQPSQSDSDTMSLIYNILVHNSYQPPMPVPAPAFHPLSPLPPQGGQPVLEDPPPRAYPYPDPFYARLPPNRGRIMPTSVPESTSAPVLPQSLPNWDDLLGQNSGETAQAQAHRMAQLEARRERRRLYIEQWGKLRQRHQQRQQQRQQQQAGTESQIPSDGPSEIPRARYRLGGSRIVQSTEAGGSDRVEQSGTVVSDAEGLMGPSREVAHAFPSPIGH